MSSKFRKLAPRAAALLLAAALAGGAPVQAAPAVPAALAEAAGAAQTAAQIDAIRIVGLGDSLTAGYEMSFADQANPVPYGYVDRLFEQALFRGRAEAANYGILGLKVGDLHKLLAAVESGASITVADLPSASPNPRAANHTAAILAASAEIRTALQGADIVAMTIGANDFSGLVRDSAASSDRAAWLENMLAMYDVELDASLRLIYKLQPAVRVVVADQYSPVPFSPLLPVTKADYDFYWEAAGKLKAKLEEVAARFKSEGYDMRVAYAAEGFKGQEAALTTIIASRGADFHPNQEGYAVMGDAFAEAVWGESRTVAPRPADVPISVVVNGKEVISEFKPILKNGRTYLVLRNVSDAVGAGLQWDNKTKTATLKLNGHTVALTVGSSSMLVDGVKTPIDAPAFLQQAGKEQKTYVPLSAIATGLGLQVVYRGKLKTAFINS